MLGNGCMINLADSQLVLATIILSFTHVSFLFGGGIAVQSWWGDVGGSGGEMVRCWYVASRELLVRRFDAVFCAVPHLPFNVRVGYCCLIVNHVRVVRMATRSL